MTIYTIEQKMSNTGSIHDLASDNYDRDIRFPAGHKYAVVLAASYGGKGYTTHYTAEAAAKESRQQSKWSHSIIDLCGNDYRLEYTFEGWIAIQNLDR